MKKKVILSKNEYFSENLIYLPIYNKNDNNDLIKENNDNNDNFLIIMEQNN